ncbi:MAG: ATP-binding protein, partial [Clostridia bacterium]|nr:ATP-binding protein [Clostridia bacterium]
DRIDLHVEVDAVSFEDLRSAKKEESSAVIKERVNRARAVQEARYKGTGRHSNAEMDAADLKRFCEIDADCERLLKEAFDKLKMSARAYTRVLKVARTIADMAGEEKIRKEHLIEAIGYRTLDRKYWN